MQDCIDNEFNLYSPNGLLLGSTVPWPEFVSTRGPFSLQWRHNDGVWNYRRLDCLLNRLFMHGSNKTLNFLITGFCEGNPSVTDGLPQQRASDAQNISIWLRHHATARD